MGVIETLTGAIGRRKPVKFEYNKPGKIKGIRVGNPHAVFVFTAKASNVQSTKAHIVQVDGVSDTDADNEFRMFDVGDMSSVECLEDADCFELHEKYNPDWDGYSDVIAKV